MLRMRGSFFRFLFTLFRYTKKIKEGLGYDYQSLKYADVDFNTKIFINRFAVYAALSLSDNH